MVTLVYGYIDSVYAVANFMHSPIIASGSIDRTIKFWDLQKECLKNSITSLASCKAVAISNDDKIFISGHIDGTIKMWDVNNGSLIKEIKDLHKQSIQSLEISPDSKYLLSNSKYIITQRRYKLHRYRIE